MHKGVRGTQALLKRRSLRRGGRRQPRHARRSRGNRSHEYRQSSIGAVRITDRRNRTGVVEVTILGPLALRVDGRDRPAPPAARRLLIYLALENDMRSRDVLTSLLWPGMAKDRARARLSQALHQLKSALGRHGDHILRVEGDAIGLRPETYSFDVRTFRHLAVSTRKDDHAQALTLARGELQAHGEPGNARWQSWFGTHARVLEGLGADLFQEAVRDAREQGELARAQEAARQWIAFSPFDEAAHLALMEVLSESGLENAARAHGEIFIRRLAEERGQRPGEDLTNLRQELAERMGPRAHRESVEEGTPGFHKGTVAVLACHLRKAPEGAEALVVRHYPLFTEVARIFGGVAVLNPNGSLEIRFYDQEDTARRATECAVRVQSRLGADVIRGLGVHCGLALVMDDASPQIMGDVSWNAHDLAFRGAGQILVSESIRAAAPTAFRYTPADPPEIPGLDAFRIAATGEGSAAPLVHTFGRESEQRALRATWARALRSGRGALIHIYGEPGIGKTHLLRQFCQDLPTGTVIRHYHCTPEHQRSVLGPIAEVVRDILGCRSTSIFGYQELQARLRERGISDTWLVEVLAAWLGIPVPTPMIETQSAAADYKEALYESVLDILAGDLGRAARVVIVDDAQWADPSSMELLSLFIKRIAAIPCLLVLASRERAAMPVVTGSAPIEMPLKPLSEIAAAQLILDAAPETPLAVRREILERGAGTPLFLKAIAHLADGGGVSTQVPESLQEILIGRIYAVGSAAKLAQAASILGQSFHADHLAHLCDAQAGEFARALGALKDAGILVWGDDQQVRFAHALYFDAARATVPQEQWRIWHRKAALFFSHDARWSATYPERLAEHFYHGGALGEALTYWRLAARRAATLLAPQSALLHLTAALQAIEESPDPGALWRQELAIRCDFAAASWGVEGFSSGRARANLTRLLALCEQRDVRGPTRYLVLRHAWLGAFGLGDMREAERAGHVLAQAAPECEDPEFGVAVGHFALGVSLLWQGRIEAAAAALKDGTRHCRPEFHALSRKLLGEDVAVSLRAYQAISHLVQGAPDRGFADIDALGAEAEASGVHASIAYVLTIHGALAFFQRDLERAARVVARLEQVCAEASLTLWDTVASIYRAWVEAESGHWTQDAAEHLRTALARIDAVWRSGLSFCSTIQCAALLAAGDPEFPTAARDARALIDTMGASFMRPYLLLQEGLWHRRFRDPRMKKTAMALVQQAEALAREQGNHSFAARARATLEQWKDSTRRRTRPYK